MHIALPIGSFLKIKVLFLKARESKFRVISNIKFSIDAGTME
jgi:hypothetical protein